jgi:Tfp pilus assembly protein PilF
MLTYSQRHHFKIACIALGLASVCSLAAAADSTPTEQPARVSASDRISLAREAIKAKDWKKALSELNAAVKDEPKNADIHNLLGYANRKQAQPNLPKAFEHYKKALELNPQHKGAHEYIGEAYLMDKKPAEAEKHLASLEKICGNKICEEYADLAKSLADYRTKNP